MRTKIILLISLVFLVCTGACAGRQRPSSTVRAERLEPLVAPDAEAQSMPDQAENSVSEAPAVPDEVASAPVVAKKRVARERSRPFQMQINLDARKVIEAHNAWLRSVSERVYGTSVPPTLPANDEIVAALRHKTDRIDRSSKAVAKASPVRVKLVRASKPSQTPVVAQNHVPTRPLTPLPPKVRERESAAALAVLESPDPTALGVVSSVQAVSAEASTSVVRLTNMPARRSSAAVLDAELPSVTPVDSRSLPAPAASASVSSPLHPPAIIASVIFGLLLGYMLSRSPARVSSFDDDIVCSNVPVFSPARAVSDQVLTREVLPPTPFPEGSGHHAAHSGDLSAGQIAPGEIIQSEHPAPSEAPPPAPVRLN